MSNATFAPSEINPLADPNAYYRRDFKHLSLSALAARGGKVTRVRFLKENGLFDLSYIHGELADGTPVHVTDAPAIFLARRYELKGLLIDWAKEAKVYAKGLGLLDESRWSIL